jgi:hypothetical protein
MTPGDDMDDLFGKLEPDAFGGESYDPQRDFYRLHGQLRRVYEVMKDGQWHSVNELVASAGGTAASITARVRDLRKQKFGARLVERKHVKAGFFLYRLVRGDNFTQRD